MRAICSLMGVLCLLTGVFTGAFQDVLYDYPGKNKDLTGWKVRAGNWSMLRYLRSSKEGLQLLLFEKSLGDQWQMHVRFSKTDAPSVVAWWRDSKNWLGVAIDRQNSGLRWTGVMNGKPIQSGLTKARLNSVVRLAVTRQGAKLTAEVEQSKSTHQLGTTKEGQVGFRSEGRYAEIHFVKIIEGVEPSPASVSEPSAPEPASFVVDPGDLDKLASLLAERCRSDEAIGQLVRDSNVAIATFDAVDIPSPSVVKNIMEDLYTAMIDNDFRLVERGQLDKVMKELKIQSSGMIDPKTAQQIGNLTGATLILVGSVSDRGKFVVVNARMIETKTGRSIIASRVEMQKVPIRRY